MNIEKFLIKFSGGLIKTHKQAITCLIVVTVISLALLFFTIADSGSSSLQGLYYPEEFNGSSL
jgi:hypothetical protein